MTVIVYQNNTLYADKLIVDKNIGGSNQVRKGEKIYRNVKPFDFTIAATGELLSSLQLSIISSFLYANIVRDVIMDHMPEGEIHDKLLPRLEAASKLFEAVSDTLPMFIGGAANYVYYHDNGLTTPQKGRLATNETYCQGSDALPVYCLIKRGFKVRDAIARAAENSDLITPDSMVVKLTKLTPEFIAECLEEPSKK